MSTISLTGLDEVERALGQLGVKVGTKVMRKALREGAKIVQRQVKANTPKGTGQMARALVVRGQKRKSRRRGKGTIGVNVLYNTKKFPQLRKGRAFYPAIIEYGTSRIPARPFFRRAWSATQGAALKKIITVLKAGLAKAVRET